MPYSRFNRRFSLLAACASLAAFGAGCASDPLARHLARQLAGPDEYSLLLEPSWAGPCPTIELAYSPDLAGGREYEVYETDYLRAEYPAHLEQSAGRLAESLAEAVELVFAFNGIRLEHRPAFQFVMAECWPAGLKISETWPAGAQLLPIPFPLSPGSAPMTEPYFGLYLPEHLMFTAIHELADHALTRSASGALLEDVPRLVRPDLVFGTWWLREGLALDVATEVCALAGLESPFPREFARQSLAHVGLALLEGRFGPGGNFAGSQMQAAAMGLIQSIRSRAGSAAIARVMAELRAAPYADGELLAAAIESATGAPLESFF